MTVYPFAIDSDSDIMRIEDDITELGGEAINQLREAMFAVQRELGITPKGSLSSVANRLDVSINSDGSLKASALTSVGLATLPISDSQVGTNAGIKEYKLSLDHTTSDLYTLITSNAALLASLTAFAEGTDSNLLTHIGGGSTLIDGSPGRHVASHIDLNDVPSDTRDPLFIWSGLLDKNGNLRSATTVGSALLQINTDFVDHQNAVANAHVATSIDLDVDNFEVIPSEINTVQKFVDYIDDFDVVTLRQHRADQHANAIPLIARSQQLLLPDGYGWQNVVEPTACSTFLVRSPNTMPVDDISIGDDLVSFHSANSGFAFDAQFVRVQVGDIIRINYANGMEASYPVESIRFIPGSEWIVRINGVNLADSDGYAFARIDRPMADRSTAGVLAVAAANATPAGSFDSILQSVIVGHPKGAVAVGLGFDPGQIDETHYKLYLELYPTGNPADRVITLPFIDVSGNAGVTPGQYTLDSVVQSTNDNLRYIGYNYRFIAFNYNGQFGIMVADAINNASFSITSGNNSSGTLAVGSFTENVIGDAVGDGFDALGLGQSHAAISSPAFLSSFVDSTAALLPTKVIVPAKYRNYIVDGVRFDGFASTWLANSDGYWDGYISARNPVGAFTIETTYAVELDLRPAGLKPGKTIVIQPTVSFSDPLYNDVDYGRFIIKSVSFALCPGEASLTLITVINSIHATGNGFGSSAVPTLPVRLYFGEDSVSFNNQNIIDTSPGAIDYHRLHEIFISNKKETFGHERARMRVQSETTSLLETSNWHIDNVYSKLRGYKDSATTFNRFVRFYILSYDTDTGEYDGYIGQRSPSTTAILKPGPVTRGRKNISTRFYDETNIDFIDLVFVESSITSPGTPILSDGTSGGGGTHRYVDIELFPSLQLDDEMMLLATVEVNWDPQTNQDIIQRVHDRRQFGSIDEEDFTNSAKDFISAGDRFLHENGVLRGLDFDFINDSDNREIFYKGGAALVNGAVVYVNAISVTIPEIHENGTPPPTTEDWAVCVNSSGNLEPILITATKQQFFAKDNNGTSTYYVPSVTFAELVETRRDLTPISVITANIASITIQDSDVLDVRRFIDDGKHRELVYSPIDSAGTFHTEEALVNWVNSYNSSSPLIVKVRGTFEIATSLDFTGLTNHVVLDGDGAVFNVTANKGILVDGFVKFKNIYFTYNPSGFLTSTDNKINGSNGCFYSSGSVSNFEVSGCSFSSSIAGQRPPFISMEIDNGNVINNVVFDSNEFSDASGADYQSAIAIVNKDTVAGVNPAILYNVRITDNNCDRNQGIFILQEAIAQVSFVNSIGGPGTRAYDVIVSGNNCGVIGFIVSGTDTASAIPLQTDRRDGLIIKNNSCHLIANMANYISAAATVKGTTLVVPLSLLSPYSAGSVDIHNNHCNVIYITVTDHDFSADEYARISIESNKIAATDPTILNNWRAAFFGTTDQTVGINVVDGSDDGGEVIIANNILSPGLVDNTIWLFLAGIGTSVSSNITGNIIRGLASTGFGIIAIASNAGFRQYNISKNQIFRAGVDISRYIELDSDATRGGGIVADNWLDDFTLDGSDDETITGTGTTPGTALADSWVVKQNKNQTDRVYIPGISSKVQSLDGNVYPVTAISNLFIIGGGFGSRVTPLTTPDIIFNAGGAVSSNDWNMVWDLDRSVPSGAYIVSVALGIGKQDTTPGGTAILRIRNGYDAVTVDGTPTWNFATQGNGTLVTSTVTAPDESYRSGKMITADLDMSAFTISGSSSPLVANSLLVVYRW